jgi:hypothetical protein
MQDGAGGAYVCWRDTRNALAGDAWAQRLDADGTPLWTTNGVAVSDGWTSTSGPSVCEDGSGGLLVGWHGDVGLRAQRVGPDGTLAWATNGVLVSSAWLTYFDLELVADGNGGAIAAARTNPAQGSSDIHAEHVDAGGNLGGAVAAPWVEAAGPGARVSAYPNPFRGTITLEIDASRSAAAVSATVFDAAGRRVRSLVAPADGGVARVRWDGRDASGRPVPAGVYFVRAADGGATGRVVHLR